MEKIISCFCHIRELYRQAKRRFCEFRKENWKDTGRLPYWAAVLLFALCAGLMSGTFMRPAWIGFLLVFLLAVPTTALAIWVGKKILGILLRNGVTECLSWLLLWLCCVVVMAVDLPEESIPKAVAFAGAFSLILLLLLKSLWALCYHKVHTRAVIVSLVLAGLPTVAMLAVLAGGGFQDTYIEAYLELGMQQKERYQPEGTLTGQERSEFLSGMEDGPYQVGVVSYGTGEEGSFPSKSVDLSRFAENKGVDGFFKERYQGYPLTEVPLAGKVWYPKRASNCPALFLIHGNHNWITDSYLGYGYLGDYLASHGYVVVSVDENACNGLSNENDGRAVLLLENIRQLEAYNNEEGNPLHQKIDYGKLALAGHSRGGEAIATAYLFQGLDYYPDNGNREFDYHFSIRSLVAIAPTCGQYRPSGRDVELEDVNYFVIHGSNDQDVNTFMGMEQYEDVAFTGKKGCMKASLYLAGANHGQFNSLWGQYDLMEPVNRALNVGGFLSQQEQQQIAKVFIKSFLDQTMGEARAYGGLLADCRAYGEFLPETLYVQSYQTSDLEILCNFEEDVRLETGTAPGTRIQAEYVGNWREGVLEFSDGSSRGNYAVILKWDKEGGAAGKEACMSVSMPKMDLEGKTLQFDIMDLQEGFAEGEAKLLDLEIVAEDSQGKEAVVQVGEYCAIYPAFLVRLNKLQYIWKELAYKHQFQTVSIPMEDFTGVDRAEICKVTFRFPEEKGKVAIDNIGVR